MFCSLSRKVFCFAIAVLLMAPASSAFAAKVPQRDVTIVLVHGAFADGSSWSKVIPILQAEGYHVVAVQNPLTSLHDDVTATQHAISATSGKVVLVGHSWGGTVITEAGNDDKVQALVYVAAFAPSEGEASTDLGKDLATPPGLADLKPDSNGFMTLTPDSLAKNFAQDLPASMTQVMAAYQGPVAGSAFGDKVTTAAWKTRPNYYVVAANDRMINPDLQRRLAEKLNAKVTTLKSSHVPMLSQAKGVADVILAAAKAHPENAKTATDEH